MSVEVDTRHKSDPWLLQRRSPVGISCIHVYRKLETDPIICNGKHIGGNAGMAFSAIDIGSLEKPIVAIDQAWVNVGVS